MSQRSLVAVALVTLFLVPAVAGELGRASVAAAQAQTVCRLNPSPPDRADPSIRVYAPVPQAHAAGSLRVAGQARVFEAVVSLALYDAAGRAIAEGTAMAEAGAPQFAPFATTLSFSVAGETPACLWVFEESARDGSPTNVVQVPLTLVPASARYIEAELDLGEQRPCIPASGAQACDANRLALWNGDAEAWARQGVTDPDAVFRETVVFRVRAGDPVAIRNIARILGWPYLQITYLDFAGAGQNQVDEFVEITNLGGGPQDVGGWTVRAPDRNEAVTLPQGYVLNAGQSCRVYAGFATAQSCGGVQFRGGDIWPDGGGTAVLYADPIALSAAETAYRADPANQPPPPNLSGIVVVAAVLPSSTPSPTPSPPPTSQAFQFTLTTPQSSYQQGESIPFTMTLRNISSQPATLTFPTGQDFDIVVRNQAGEEVWRWSEGRVFTQQIREVTFQPGEARQWNATWDQRADDRQAPPGTYTAYAVTSTRTEIRSNTITFQIAQQRQLEFRLSTPENTYAQGEEVPFRMVLRNTGSQPAMLQFPTGQDFDVVVRNQGGDVVWRWSQGRAFTQAVRNITLQPGEERTYSATWDQRNNNGAQAPPGSYSATATLTASDPIQSNTVAFQIAARSVDATLNTPKSDYQQGEAVPFKLGVRNTGSAPVTLTFPTGQEYDVVVSTSAGQEVWRWSSGRAFTQAMHEVTLGPGEERTWVVTWDQRNNNGQQLPSGTYEAVGIVTTQDPIRSNTVTIRIQ